MSSRSSVTEVVDPVGAAFRQVVVVDVIRETADAHSLVLEPLSGGPQPAYRPGQFLTVRVPGEGTTAAARCYSLSSSPHTGEPMKVTVKRTAGGYASNWICDNVTTGTVLDVLPPSGLFTPRSLDEDLLLLAGGSGITPIMSILTSCLVAGSGSVVLLYANRDQRSVIFADELEGLRQEHPDRLVVAYWLETERGIPTAAGLAEAVEPLGGRQVFLCGPAPFMACCRSMLRAAGARDQDVHVERFVSLAEDPFLEPGAAPPVDDGDACTVDVELDGVRSTVAWPRSSTLLAALHAAGIEAPFSCREGRCGACTCTVLDGAVRMDRNDVLDEQEVADGYALGCQSRPLTERVSITYDL